MYCIHVTSIYCYKWTYGFESPGTQFCCFPVTKHNTATFKLIQCEQSDYVRDVLEDIHLYFKHNKHWKQLFFTLKQDYVTATVATRWQLWDATI